MTRKDTERLVREQMQQTLPDKDALWAKIENSLGEQKPVTEQPAPPIRMQIVYRVMGAAACLLLILGGIGIFAEISRHSMRYETAPMTADNAVRKQAEDSAADDADYAAPAMEQSAEEMDAAADDAVYEENEDMDAPADAEPDYGHTAGIAADGAKQATADGVQKADDATRAPEAFAGEQNAVSSAANAQSSEFYADAARDWLTEHAPEIIPTITNLNAPEVTQVNTLPADYAPVTNEYDTESPCWCVHFTTTQDAVLGAEDVYVDANGVVFALSLRE